MDDCSTEWEGLINVCFYTIWKIPLHADGGISMRGFEDVFSRPSSVECSILTLRFRVIDSFYFDVDVFQ